MVVADRFFAGSVPEIYDGFLVPLIFDCYASDLAERLACETKSRTANRCGWKTLRKRQPTPWQSSLEPVPSKVASGHT
jgi:hypothetical protein